jgi:glutamyl-tRNA synthetase
MLAVVVDDHDMGVTHVIRGDDHLNNAFRQLGIIKAMGWEEPIYAHIPLIHGSDGAKLSKRHGALGVDAYRDEMGMLPEAVLNYLLRLGWGYGDEETISRDRAIELFDISGVGRSPSRFDIKKLENLNAFYLREADDARLAALVLPRISVRLSMTLPEHSQALLTQAIPSLKPRAKTLNEIAEGAEFLFKNCPLDFDEKALALLDDSARELLGKTADALDAVQSWTVEAIEDAIRRVAEDAGLGLGKVAQPLRAALTGRTVSPGIFDVLFLLGKDKSLERLADARTASPADGS